MDGRELRAIQIAATAKLEPSNGRWAVPSQSGVGSYSVVVTEAGTWACSCPDHETRLVECKHILAVEFTVRRENSGKAAVTFTELVKVTYSQDWSAYNLAQTREGEHFPELLGQLCALVPQPPHETGRPPLLFSDMAFAVVFKAYSRFSSRRFASDLRRAEQDGHIVAAPSFNSLLRYTRDPAMTPILNDLVTVSSLPLKAVETEFAVDSSGFGTRRTVSWFSKKHGRVVPVREWVKLHLITGVRTHIVTGVEVTGWAANDAPYLSSLLRGTAANFDVREVSADKGYLTKKNVTAIERVGATPFIPLKSNTVQPPNDDSPWSRMWHLYSFNRQRFLEHYHRRSNVESTFAMLKAKFGDDVLGKTDTAQVNEVLAKVIAHNLCVLIQSFYELGIDPAFGAGLRVEPELDSAAAF